MAQEYLTIKEAMVYSGRSEETIRRWIRSTRAQFLIEIEDTNQELEQKTPLLRKQNETHPDGAPRQDRHGVPVFDWLLLRSALDESFHEEGQPPSADSHQDPHSSNEGTHDHPQDHPQEETQVVSDPPQEGTQQSGEGGQDDPQDEYMWIPRGTYQALLAQLDTKDKQLERKDDQIDAEQTRNREVNVLLQGYQGKFGALPAPRPDEEPAKSGSELN